MDYFFTIVLVLHVIVALVIIGLVLLQHGKGADMGAAFGSGSSGSVFGATGSANFLSRATGALAALFFLTSLGLTWSASTRTKASGADAGIMGTVGAPKPAVPGAADPAKATDVPKPAQDAPKSEVAPKSDAGAATQSELKPATDTKADAKPAGNSVTPEKGSGVPK